MGKLFLVATPIGNLSDLSPRAIETLKNADLIAAEDTRNSIRLLNHFDIKVPMTSYHEYNRIEKAEELIGKMQSGADIALITDAGMPAISDPGEDLVRMAYDAGIEVTIIPGPCAAVSALALSGLPTGRFTFEGFLPNDKNKKELSERLDALKDETRTIIFYEAPHRLTRTLKLLAQTFGETRKASAVRELTKVHEEVNRSTLGELLNRYETEEPRGEFVIIVEGRSRKEIEEEKRSAWDDITIPEHVKRYMQEGLDKKEAMKKVAADRGIGKRDVYKQCTDLN